MYCMKCGRETKDNQIFCEACQADMTAYPVKPGTPVQLPSRPVSSPPRKAVSRRKSLPAADQISRLRRAIQWMALTIIILIAALSFCIFILIHSLNAQNTQKAIGQNYSTMTQTDGN